MDLRVLGRMEALRSGTTVSLGPPKQRLALAALVLHAGHPVSADSLIDQLWPRRPPASAKQNVHLYICRIRHALGRDRLLTCGRLGYLLVISRDELDAYRFSDLVDDAQHAIRHGDHVRAAVLVREALAEWRGGAFAEFDDNPMLQTEAARLADLRLQAMEQQNEVDLLLGDHLRSIGKLRQLVIEHPYRERFHEQLVLALYLAGRTAEALEAVASIRQTLADELGLEPGAGLRELQRRILQADPDLGRRAGPSAA
jgi:DNA-binding SARP family transcriptional activator